MSPRSNPHLLTLFLVLILLLTVLIQDASATYLTMQVDARKSRCHYEELNAGQAFDLYFEVIRGGLLDIKFQLTDPNRNVVIDRVAFFNKPTEEQNSKEGTILYTAKTTGTYKFCFDNTSSRWTAKVLSFEIRSTRANKLVAVELKDLGPMVDTIISLSNDLDSVEKNQRTNRIHEKQHFIAVRELSSLIQWLVIISSLIVLGLTLLSVRNIQKWFDTPDTRRSGFV